MYVRCHYPGYETSPCSAYKRLAGVYIPQPAAPPLTCPPPTDLPPPAGSQSAHLLTCLHQCPHHKAGCPAGLVVKPPSGLAGVQRGRARVDGQAEDGGHLRRGPGTEQGAPVEAEGQQLQAGEGTDGPSGFNYTHAGRNWGSGGLVLCHGSAGKTSPP